MTKKGGKKITFGTFLSISLYSFKYHTKIIFISLVSVPTPSLQVIIDSQPLTVAVLAAFLFGESIGLVGAAGLVLGVLGLLLLEVLVFPLLGIVGALVLVLLSY